ncbi:tRNA uridine(34) 5-carboxymethylaminomethyl modification radical SAM/GNAT enzyme Elp3 [Candidatus Uhrbacteria bacterium]|nr:tRNA uridine(34) 5-carboxymethylaminomethyl modification radical SAM/GNAT enzyme Elp3 [Candidatus Uhrbacteria bacterium]
MSTLAEQIVKELLSSSPQSHADVNTVKRRVAGTVAEALPSSATLLHAYRALVEEKKTKRNPALEQLLQKRAVRTLSGVAIITVLAKPYPCPGKCTYCPTEVRMPKSYLEREPAAQRALILHFDPYVQVRQRIEMLQTNGHPTDKIELIVKGGTWSAYTPLYQRWFLKRCYDAANDASIDTFDHNAPTPPSYLKRGVGGVTTTNSEDEGEVRKKFATRLALEQHQSRNEDGWADATPTTDEELLEAQRINETASHRIIGLTLETRPDWITPKEVRNLRVLGCTRIELGVQNTDNKLLDRIQRGHTIEDAKRATALLRAGGFKVDFHLMPQLPDATPASDIAMFDTLWADADLRPDMIKIYPCVVLESAELYKEWKAGTYKPYAFEQLVEALITIKSRVPRYVRISRLIRDIPSDYIKDGNHITNLREILQKKMHERGLVCNCLRCRELGHQRQARPLQLAASSQKRDAKLFIDEYEASAGKEVFLSFEDAERTTVFGFCRLRLPGASMPEVETLLPEIRNAAFIRELHTYGHLVPIEKEETGSLSRQRPGLPISDDLHTVQHTGLGRQLMERAEAIAREHGFKKMAVIAGVGVREYYRKLGYALEGTYMTKALE